MRLSELPRTKQKSKKRIGRGHGSGRGGHTSTRGTKGQKARGKIGIFFEGTKLKKSLIKKLPLYRGKGKFKPRRKAALVVNLKYLNLFKEGDAVNLVSLQEKGILEKQLPVGSTIKILGDGEINVPLIICFPVSKSAREKIEKAGGRVAIADEERETKSDKLEVGAKKERKKKMVKKSSKVKEKNLAEGE